MKCDAVQVPGGWAGDVGQEAISVWWDVGISTAAPVGSKEAELVADKLDWN